MLMTQLVHPIRQRSSRRPRDRRGVLLLVVLGMLAMFGLIGLAFVMLTGHARRGAEALRRKEFYVENHQKFANEALLQILRGTNNPSSVLQNHSLLEDVYGNNWAEGTVNGTPAGGTQLMDFTFNPVTDLTSDIQQIARVGRVLTFTTGAAAGQSVRIVARPNTNIFRVVSPTIPPGNTDEFVINGAPFSGTGFGYNLNAAATDPQLSAQYVNQVGGSDWKPLDNTTWDVFGTPTVEPLQALFPNTAAFQSDYFLASALYTDPSGPGGANEDYDAPDYQNMLLALQLPNGNVLSPSLHRPSLINFWDNQFQLNLLIDTGGMNAVQRQGVLACPLLLPASTFNGGAADIEFVLDLKRRMSLRPLQEYHPNFTGSNPNYWPLWNGDPASGLVQLDLDPGQAGFEVNITQPEWDVDNDGDGIKDSIWVDLGLPVQTMKDGRQFKPLVAILCVDLDGRLNLNAHGNLAQTSLVTPTDLGGIVAGGAPAAADRGQGVGVAEVDLSQLFDGSTVNFPDGSTATLDYLPLLQGDAANNIPGRYGADLANTIMPSYTPGNDTIREKTVGAW